MTQATIKHKGPSEKPRKYARGRDTWVEANAAPFPFTKTALRARLRQLNTPERLEWNDGKRTPVSFAMAELTREAR
jgi:hypothetical protein